MRSTRGDHIPKTHWHSQWIRYIAAAMNKVAATAGTKVVAIAEPKLWPLSFEMGRKNAKYSAKLGAPANAKPTTATTVRES